MVLRIHAQPFGRGSRHGDAGGAFRRGRCGSSSGADFGSLQGRTFVNPAARCALMLLFVAAPQLSTGAPLVLRVQVRAAGGSKIVQLPLENYVAAVLAGESSVFQSGEA